MGRSRKTFGILLDWPDPNSMYQGTLLKGIRAFADEYNINIITLVAGRLGSPDKMENDRELLYDFMDNDKLFAGFILFSSPLSVVSGSESLLKKVRKATHLPLVSIAIDFAQMPAVLIDNKPGFQELIEHMILHHGYSDVAYISGPEKNSEAAERLAVIRQTFAKHKAKLPETHIYFGNFTVGSGIEGIRCFLDERKISPQAVICANDYMAMGAWEELGSRGIAVPEDIVLTGFDDLQISDMFDLPLTTIKQPLFDQGYHAAEKLLRIVGKKRDQRVTYLPSKMVYRNSCGCDISTLRPYMGTAHKGKNSSDNLFKEESRMFRKAVSSSIRTHDTEPLIRCWNLITRSALRKRLRQSEVIVFLRTLLKEYNEGTYPEKEKEIVNLHVDKMQLMTTEAYVQADALERMGSGITTDITLARIENLGSDIDNTLNMEERLRSVDWFFSDSGIQNCYLSLFENLQYLKSGRSKLIYCRKDGNQVFVPENKSSYPTRQLLSLDYLPQNRFEILVELLFDQRGIFGLITLDMKDIRFSFYEMLRTRFSTVIHDSINKKLLKDAIQRLHNLSLTDDLTGLYNRRGFFTMSNQQLQYCIRENVPHSVYYIDMDGLKTINDTMGHDEGDRAIQVSAEIIQKSFRKTDIIARLGGDEFAIFASNTSEEDKDIINSRLLKNAGEANLREDIKFTISMSMGICPSCALQTDDTIATLEKMLRKADQQMYKVKKQKIR